MYVCTQLTAPDASGLQTCIVWQSSPDLIPDLSSSDVAQLTAAFAFFIAVVSIFKLLRRSI